MAQWHTHPETSGSFSVGPDMSGWVFHLLMICLLIINFQGRLQPTLGFKVALI